MMYVGIFMIGMGNYEMTTADSQPEAEKGNGLLMAVYWMGKQDDETAKDLVFRCHFQGLRRNAIRRVR